MSVKQEKFFFCQTEERVKERLKRLKKVLNFTEETSEERIREKLKATCMPSQNKTESSKKTTPLIVKPTSEVQIKFGPCFPDGVDPSVRLPPPNAATTISETPQKKVPVIRPISPPINFSRGRLSSPPPNEKPSLSPRRTTSPSRIDLKDDAVNERIQTVLTARFYVVQRPGPCIFLIASDSPKQTHRVTIGTQECSCGKGPHCVHLLFVMLRVFGVSKNDSMLRCSTLKNYEVESLIFKYESQHRRISLKSETIVKRNFHSSTEDLSKSPGEGLTARSRPQSMPDIRSSSREEAEDNCPICLRPMSTNEMVVVCKTGCKNCLHYECMCIWAEECKHQKESVVCPLCRGIWPPGSIESLKALRKEQKTGIPTRIESKTSNSKDLQSISSSSSSCISSVSSTPISLHGPTHTDSSLEKSVSLSPPEITSSLSTARCSLSDRVDDQCSSPVVCSREPSTGSPSRWLPFCSSQILHLQANKEKYEEWAELFEDEVKNLFSFDWTCREKGLKYLYSTIVTVLAQLACEESLVPFIQPKQSIKIISVCCEILATMAHDPVYKVYVACLRCFRGLLAYVVCKTDEEMIKLQANVKPIVKAILIKCSDGNRRINQLSVASLMELCKGSNGEFAVGRQTRHPAPNGIGGVSFLLSCILEPSDVEPQNQKWLWCLGRLYVLDRLIEDFPSEFYLLYVQVYPKEVSYNLSESCGHKLVHLDRIVTVLSFAQKLMNHEHLTVRKMSRRVFVLAARLTSHIPPIFIQVCNMLVAVDVNLETKLKDSVRTPDKGWQFPSELLEQVQKYQEHDETIIYTSVHHPKRRSSLGRSFPSSPVQFQDRALILEKLGHNFPCSNCSASKCASQQWLGCNQQCSQGSIFDQESNFKEKRLSRSGVGFIGRPTFLPLVGQYHKNPANINPYNRLEGRSSRPSKPECLWTSSRNTFLSVSSLCGSTNNSEENSCCMHSFQIRKPHKKVKEITAPPNTPSHCPVGDLIDLSGPPPVMTSTPRGENCRRNEITTKAPPGSSGANHLASILNQELRVDDATLLAKAVEEQLFLQTSLPIIPGLTDMSYEPFDSEELYLSLSLTEDERTNEADAYLEGAHWIRGQLLGTGAFSSCYQARDVKTGTIMAVKQVSFCRNSEEEQENQMLAIRDEIIMMLKLDHPNIVRMLGATLQGNHYNMFVEWMPGGSVSALLGRYGAFTETVILRYIKQVLAGLACLHDNQILHRDLKGANLLVDSTGHHLRIGDFGAAARMASQRTIADEFKGQLLGTIAFMAPEVLRGEGYGRSCDVWSVGCVVIEMATTKPPWDAVDISNDLALLYKIACSKNPPPIPPELSPVMRAIALKCLEPKSENRPPAKELLRESCFL